jgi:uncharacterized membrane protein YgaE (UPF0421/DUF939 family)
MNIVAASTGNTHDYSNSPTMLIVVGVVMAIALIAMFIKSRSGK